MATCMSDTPGRCSALVTRVVADRARRAVVVLEARDKRGGDLVVIVGIRERRRPLDDVADGRGVGVHRPGRYPAAVPANQRSTTRSTRTTIRTTSVTPLAAVIRQLRAQKSGRDWSRVW